MHPDTWKRGDIVSFATTEDCSDLQWGFMEDCGASLVRGEHGVVKATYVMAPYPKPSVNLIPGAQLTEWEMMIESRL